MRLKILDTNAVLNDFERVTAQARSDYPLLNGTSGAAYL